MGGANRVQERGADTGLFELAQRARGRARRRGDSLAQRDRMHVLVAQQLGVPSMVWITSWLEISRERPSSTPASIIDSTSSEKYAGPEPETAVTTSMYGSATRTTGPRWRSASSARLRWASSAWAPAQMAAIPSRTMAGVFGIARITGTPSGRRLSYQSVESAAATDSSVCSGPSARPDLREQRRSVLRLDRDDHERRTGRRGRVIGLDGRSVALGQLVPALLAARGERQIGRGAPAGLEEAAHERLAEPAGAQDRDAVAQEAPLTCVGSWPEQPVAPELAHGVDDRQQRLALVAQRVLDARRRLGEAAAKQDALGLERLQPLGQRARRDSGAGALELLEAARALGHVVQQDRRPLRRDDVGGRRDRAAARVVDLPHRPV